MDIASTQLELPPLRSGGLMLGYRCGQNCRHCAYRCRPGAGEWMTEDTLDRVVERLSAEKHLVDLHIGGGEATLNPDLLAKAITKLRAAGVRMSYLETNAFYAKTPQQARKMLAPLKEAGLPGVLVSVSPYHNEFVPLQYTLNCLNAAEEIFGLDGVFPWLGHFIPLMAKMDMDTTHTLEEFMEVNGFQPGDGQLLRLFPLTPGGRVPERMAEFLPRRKVEEFRGGHCADILSATSHFHIDPEGRLFTGHCPGITADDMRNSKPKREIRGADNPAFMTLALGGPHALMETAVGICGFTPDERGYCSPCHLCFEVRTVLRRHGEWPELGPDAFYEG